jgi:hypothetical protein
MLSIKEAFRYKNFIDATVESLAYYIRITENSITVKEKHNKAVVNSEAKDEELDMTTERQFACSVVDIAYLINQLIEEKLKVSNAIDDAKQSVIIEYKVNGNKLNLDSAVEYAKMSRSLADNLKAIINLKSSESKKSGTDFKFNVEGNQVSYKYNIDVIKTIDFDRDVANKLYKKLLEKADEISTKIETAMCQEIVDYAPVYGVHDSVDEIVEKYLTNRK